MPFDSHATMPEPRSDSPTVESDSSPTVVRQFRQSDSPTVRQSDSCPTVSPTVLPAAACSSTVFHCLPAFRQSDSPTGPGEGSAIAVRKWAFLPTGCSQSPHTNLYMHQDPTPCTVLAQALHEHKTACCRKATVSTMVSNVEAKVTKTSFSGLQTCTK